MRWFSEISISNKPQIGSEEIFTFFAWFPVTVKGNNLVKDETRWLEEVTIKCKYIFGESYKYWKPMEFINEK